MIGLANQSRAGTWLDNLLAEGGSDHRGGIREAISFGPDAIYLLTDADDLDERDARALRRLLRKPVRLSVAIFGSRTRPAAESPLERLAREYGGSVRYVAD